MLKKLKRKLRSYYSITDVKAAALNPPYPYNDARYRIYSDAWLSVGYIPMPKTQLGWISYHLIHGLWMRYPLLKVVLFAFDAEKNIDALYVMGGTE